MPRFMTVSVEKSFSDGVQRLEEEVMMTAGDSVPEGEKRIVGFKTFEDYCPDVMKNPKTAEWIEKEGNKARVFAVKMEGILRNPNVSDDVKKMISTPEGLVEMYSRVNAKSADINAQIERMFTAALEENTIEGYEGYKSFEELTSPKSQAYGVLVNNDAQVLSDAHWEQCYRTTVQTNDAVVEVLEEEARLYRSEVSSVAEHSGKVVVKESENLSQAREAAVTASAKMDEKLAARGGVEASKQVVEKTVKKKTKVLAKAVEVNAKFDKAVDETIKKGAEKLNSSKVGKAYEKTVTTIANTKAGKAVTTASKTVVKNVANTAKKTGTTIANTEAGKAVATASKTVANTAVGKAVGNVAGKVVKGTAVKAVGKSLLKKIPGVSAVAGTYFAYDRIKNGEWGAACCEFASGVAGCFPGLGTGISFALDGGLATNDIYNAVKQPTTKEEKNKVIPTPKKKAVTTGKSLLAKASEPKKTVTKTSSITPEAMAVLCQKQGGRS